MKMLAFGLQCQYLLANCLIKMAAQELLGAHVLQSEHRTLGVLKYHPLAGRIKRLDVPEA